jgi:hypothetical protein
MSLEETKMNTQKVRNEIEKLTANNPYRQYPANKTQSAKIAELSLAEMMPQRFLGSGNYGIGNLDAQMVIEAAEDVGGKSVGGFTAYGDGDVVRTTASALYQALHESNEVAPAASESDANGEYDPADIDPADEALDRLIDEVAEIEQREFEQLAAQETDRQMREALSWLTVDEVAETKDCHPETIRRALRRGEFRRARKVSSGAHAIWLLDAEEVMQWQPRPAGWPLKE